MIERPTINQCLDSTTFKSYYYSKEELVAFCKETGLQPTGGKLDLTERIAHYLETGEKLSIVKPSAKKNAAVIDITETTLIEETFVCSEKHRAFFADRIGKGFSFNVAFQKWLKANAGKTYQDAIEAYFVILIAKKKETSVIDRQFEYNTYIRDFFADNNGKTLDDAIKCWKYKKSLKGHNKYEKADLIALK